MSSSHLLPTYDAELNDCAASPDALAAEISEMNGYHALGNPQPQAPDWADIAAAAPSEAEGS